MASNNWNFNVEGPPLAVFAGKLKSLKGVLCAWNKEHFGDIFQNIKMAENAVADPEIKCEVDHSSTAQNQLEQSRTDLNHLLALEEVFWRQRAKKRM